MKILIADDDPVLVFALEDQLREWGYDVVSCSCGDRALELLRSAGRPQLALLDWAMPGRSGPEVCRELRSSPVSEDDYVYVIMLTGRADHDSLLQALDAGADDFVAKPYELGELRMRLRAAKRVIDFQAYLSEQALVDPLTGLLNRRGLERSLRAELARAARQASSPAVIIADLDHFKSVNDNYGHEAGDRVLQETADRIRAKLRDFDTAVRYGGEEFLIICPEADPDSAMAIAERIRTEIESRPYAVPGGETAVTASFGVSAGDPGLSGDSLIRRADNALYEAKRRGRNCVVGAWSTSSNCDLESK